jgi:serine/threonine protein kinase
MPADMKKARELFLHAVGKLPAEQWESYVGEACGGDAELEQQVVRLLKVHREAGSFLDRPAAAVGVTGALTPEPGAEAIAVPHQESAGTVIGPYKLLQQIGEGGMGTVFMAEQTQPVQRKVALKVIKAGMDSRQVIARFEAERQALAMMDHVNIARVLDAGTIGSEPRTTVSGESGPLTDVRGSGRPYFVMELVHGVPITKYCDDNQLTPRERLELFVPVCQAIQHAHQKGIIHRDIKPSNVMITLYDGKPVPKVIDFGVAKATEQKLTERSLFTQYGTMVGTLEYMSPEQAEMSALGVDTRSDIYSLGVLLYELLTGTTPLNPKRVREAAYAEVLRMIKEEEPPKPSTRLSDSGEALASISAQRHMEPAKLSKLMRGELDWIVMKCLEKDRNRRYESTNGLASDVERYLKDEPVEACPPSAWYRFRKFARRNKSALAVMGLIFFFMAALGGVTGWAVRDRAARQAKVSSDLELALDRAELFQAQGKWAEALASLRRAELLTTEAPPDPARDVRLEAMKERLAAEALDQELIARFEDIRLQQRLVDLDGRLPGFLAGTSPLASPAERIEVARLCHFRRLYRAAACFYEGAFGADPKLVDDRGRAHRYNAACAAALAGCGQGKDADNLDDKERAHLRRQALAWLRDDLAAWDRPLDKEPAEARFAARLTKVLQHWLLDPDFAGVRRPEALAKLPEAERRAWQQLWGRVADTLARTHGKTTPKKKSESK